MFIVRLENAIICSIISDSIAFLSTIGSTLSVSSFCNLFLQFFLPFPVSASFNVTPWKHFAVLLPFLSHDATTTPLSIYPDTLPLFYCPMQWCTTITQHGKPLQNAWCLPRSLIVMPPQGFLMLGFEKGAFYWCLLCYQLFVFVFAWELFRNFCLRIFVWLPDIKLVDLWFNSIFGIIFLWTFLLYFHYLCSFWNYQFPWFIFHISVARRPGRSHLWLISRNIYRSPFFWHFSYRKRKSTSHASCWTLSLRLFVFLHVLIHVSSMIVAKQGLYK